MTLKNKTQHGWRRLIQDKFWPQHFCSGAMDKLPDFFMQIKKRSHPCRNTDGKDDRIFDQW